MQAIPDHVEDTEERCRLIGKFEQKNDCAHGLYRSAVRQPYSLRLFRMDSKPSCGHEVV